MSGIEEDIRGRFSKPYDNEPLDTQVKRLADVIMAEFGEHEAWKGESLGACDLAIKIMLLDNAEIRRLRAELDKAMAIGGINRCEGCKTALVAEPQFYCRDCRP